MPDVVLTPLISGHRVVEGGYRCQQKTGKVIIQQCVLSANFQVASQIFQNICLQVCMKNAQLHGLRPFHSTEYAMYDTYLGRFFYTSEYLRRKFFEKY